ncbi:MAG: type IV pilus secretin PilQ [Desulfobacterales bacterium]|nr:type IV pilus secretin PilQ [Desulfobacterales bacterium]
MVIGNRFLLIIITILIILFYYGCSSKKPDLKSPFLDKWEIMAKESKGFSPGSSKRVIDLPQEEKKIFSEVKENPDDSLPTEKITLRMHNVDVAVLLRALSKFADQNIIINEKVIGKININVKDSPWKEVFLGILKTQGLSYVREGSILRILTADDLEQEIKKQAQKLDLTMTEPLLNKVVYVDYADSAKLKDILEKMLIKKKDGAPYGAIMVDAHTNAIIIEAIEKDVKKMMLLIRELDKPTNQIFIEAHIVEASKDTARDLGIQWGGLYHKLGDGNNFWITPGANSNGILGNPIMEDMTDDEGNVTGRRGSKINPSSGMAINFPASISGSGLYLGYAAEYSGKNILAIQLSALQTQGKLNILSKPSITTMDNQTAVIESGRKVPVKTIKDGETQIEYIPVVLRLEVNTHVIDDKTIKLEIITNKDEIDLSNAVDGNPLIITKKATTNVILFDGQTTVIGGLNKEIESKAEYGIPFLMNIPLIGALFRSNSNRNNMEEVLIFITPHILKKQNS